MNVIVSFSCTQKDKAENWSEEQMASPSVWYFERAPQARPQVKQPNCTALGDLNPSALPFLSKYINI